MTHNSGCWCCLGNGRGSHSKAQRCSIILQYKLGQLPDVLNYTKKRVIWSRNKQERWTLYTRNMESHKSPSFRLSWNPPVMRQLAGLSSLFCYCLHIVRDRQIDKQCSKHFLSHNVFILTWQFTSMPFSNRIMNEKKKVWSWRRKKFGSKKKRRWVILLFLFFRRFYLKALLCPKCWLTMTLFSIYITLKQSKLLYGKVKSSCSGGKWEVCIE